MSAKTMALFSLGAGAITLGASYYMFLKRGVPSGTGVLEVTAKDSGTGVPLSGATVDVVGPETKSGTTDGNGFVRIVLEPGTYNVAVSRSGYETDASMAIIQDGRITPKTVLLVPEGGPEPGYYSVNVTVKGNYGYVHEDGTLYDVPVKNWALDGATVKLEGPRTYTTYTGADGSASFGAVMEGEYTMTTSRYGYDTITEGLSVHSNVSISKTLIWNVAAPTWNLYSDYVDQGGGYSIYPHTPPVKGMWVYWRVEYPPVTAYALESYGREPMAPTDPTAVHNYGEIPVLDPVDGTMKPIQVVGAGDYLQLIGENADGYRTWFIAQIAKEDP